MWFSAALALELSSVVWKGDAYTVVRIRDSDQIELHGAPGGLTLAEALPPGGVAMNAGMYHPGFVPVGLQIEEGVQTSPLETRTLTGNFGLMPNGVFSISDRPRVTRSWTEPARVATQSGPLLVGAGRLHPAFMPNSANRRVRNAVGVAGDTVFFVISQVPVRFHDLATLFRDRLGCSDALYLDGTVSELATQTAPGRTFGGALVAHQEMRREPRSSSSTTALKTSTSSSSPKKEARSSSPSSSSTK